MAYNLDLVYTLTVYFIVIHNHQSHYRPEVPREFQEVKVS